MATFSSLPKERREDVFAFLGDDASVLFACIRVNRQWAEMCLPLLWRCPFETAGGQDKAVCKLIWEYISWLPADAKEDLAAQGIVIPPHVMAEQTTAFDYVGYMREIEYHNVRECVSTWLEDQCWVYASNNFGLKWQTWQVINRLLQLFMSRCTKNLSIVSIYNSESSAIALIPFHRFPGANTALSHVVDFDCRFGCPIAVDLTQVMAQVCQSIEILRAGPFVTAMHREATRRLLYAQKRLRIFSLTGNDSERKIYIDDAEAICRHCDTLESITFIGIDFLPCYSFEPLARCKNLQSLEFYDCTNISAFKVSALACARFPKLNKLALSGLRNMPTDETVSLFKSLAPCLRYIQFPLLANENQAIRLIDAAAKCSKLATVKLCGDGIFQKFLSFLPAWTGLRMLCLNVQELEPYMAELARRLPESTRSLAVITDSLSEQALRTFLDKTKANLKSMELECNQGLDDEHLTIVMRYAEKKKSLRQLGITANVLSNEKLKAAREAIGIVRVLNW